MEKLSSYLNKNDFYNILWNYFSMHANQRMQLFNFYIIIECFLLGGYFTVTQFINNHGLYRIIICILVIMFSIVFFLLDFRTKTMIKIVEKSIIEIEQKHKVIIGNEFMIFTNENEITGLNHSKFYFYKLLSYSKLFFLIFLCFSLIGIFGIITTFFPDIFRVK